MTVKSRTHATLFAVALVATALMTACVSSSERPVAQLARAEASIDSAEQAGAREYGTQNLDKARSKLNKANQLADAGEHETARRLAHKAELDAELAMAEANRGKAENSLTEINRTIETLRQEIAGGGTQ
jgi:chromosome segregation ATPase